MAISILPMITILGQAKASDTVYVYSARQERIVGPLFKLFESEHGIKVDVLYITKGLLDRIRQEGQLSPADIVLTSDLPALIKAAEEDLLLPVSDPVLNERVPDAFRDNLGRWFGLSKRVRLVYSHRERVPEDAITDFRDLADPKWKGRVCIRSGFHNYNLTLFSAMRAHFGHSALKDFLKGLKANLAYKPQGNDRFQVKSIWQGKCDLSLGNSYYYGLMLNNDEQIPWAESVRPVFARMGDSGNHVNVSAAGLLRSTQNPENAIKLITFLLSPAVQALYVAQTYEYPVVPGTVLDPLVASWGTVDADRLSLKDISDHREATLHLLHELRFDE